jgi:dTDP-4-dehydrorhamnose reductase
VLITGAGGQLGKTLTRILPEAFDIAPFSRTELDICDSTAVRQALENIRPEWLVNTAAFARVDDCETNPEPAHKVNAHAVGILAEECTRQGVRMIHFSTDYVFDGARRTPYVETDTAKPINVYGQSKLAGEKAFTASAVRGCILRVAWLYSTYSGNFLTRVLERVRRSHRDSTKGEAEPLRMTNDQIGTFTLCDEVARQTIRVMQADMQGIIHATAGGETTRYEFVRAALDLLRIEYPVEACSAAEFPAKAPRPGYSVLDNERLGQAGLDSMSHWREALERFLTQNREKLIW